MGKNKAGSIAIKSFALLFVLGAAHQARSQDATTRIRRWPRWSNT